MFGPGFRAVLAFAYAEPIQPFPLPGDNGAYEFRGRDHRFWAVGLDDYIAHLRSRGPAWKAVAMARRAFRRRVRPLREWLPMTYHSSRRPTPSRSANDDLHLRSIPPSDCPVAPGLRAGSLSPSMTTDGPCPGGGSSRGGEVRGAAARRLYRHGLPGAVRPLRRGQVGASVRGCPARRYIPFYNSSPQESNIESSSSGFTGSIDERMSSHTPRGRPRPCDGCS